MAVKTMIDFQFTELAFYVPRGQGMKNQWYKPLIGVQGDHLQRPLKVSAFREHLNENVTRAEFSGQNDTQFRMIEDVNTRPPNMRTEERMIICRLKNLNSKARATLVLPILQDGFDWEIDSGDMLALENAIKGNLSILIKTPDQVNDVPVPVDYVKFERKEIKQYGAAAAVPGIDASDEVLESGEQTAAGPLVTP